MAYGLTTDFTGRRVVCEQASWNAVVFVLLMNAPWPVIVFQQVMPASSDAHV